MAASPASAVASPELVERWIWQSNQPGMGQREAVQQLQDWLRKSGDNDDVDGPSSMCTNSHDNSVCDSPSSRTTTTTRTLIQVLFQTVHPSVQFYVLSVLAHEPRLRLQQSLTAVERGQLCHQILVLLVSQQQQQVPAYLTNKMALLWTQCLCLEWLELHEMGARSLAASSCELTQASLTVVAQHQPTLLVTMIQWLLEDLFGSSHLLVQQHTSTGDLDADTASSATGGTIMGWDKTAILRIKHVLKQPWDPGSAQQQQQYPPQPNAVATRSLLEQYFVAIVSILQQHGHSTPQQPTAFASTTTNGSSSSEVLTQRCWKCLQSFFTWTAVMVDPESLQVHLPQLELLCRLCHQILLLQTAHIQPQQQALPNPSTNGNQSLSLSLSSSPQLACSALPSMQEWMGAIVASSTSTTRNHAHHAHDQDNRTDPLPHTLQLQQWINTVSYMLTAVEQTAGLLPNDGSSESVADIHVVIALARWINAITLQMIEIIMNALRTSRNDLQHHDDNGNQSRHNDANISLYQMLLQTALGPRILDVWFRCLAYPDIDVTGAVFEAAGALVQQMPAEELSNESMEQQNNITNQCFSSAQQIKAINNSANLNGVLALRPHLPRMLQIVYSQMHYPPNFDHDYDVEDEDAVEAEEEAFRFDLRKLFVKMVRAAPVSTLQFLVSIGPAAAGETAGSTATTTTTTYTEQWLLVRGNGMVLPRQDDEHQPGSPHLSRRIHAMLQLLYQYGEGIRPPPGLKTVMKNQAFVQLLLSVHQSNIVSAMPYPHVLQWYYEVAVRYHPVLTLTSHATTPSLLASFLEVLTGPSGLQHSHGRMRSRCCYLLLKLVQAVVGPSMRSMVETTVAGIQQYIPQQQAMAAAAAASSSSSTISRHASHHHRWEDSLYLLETAGLLLGKTGLTESEQAQYLTQVITPHVHAMQEILQIHAADLALVMNEQDKIDDTAAETDTADQRLAICIAAMTALTKGFGKRPDAESVRRVLVETAHVTLSVLQAVPRSAAVRNKAMIHLQRLIPALDRAVLPHLPVLLQLCIEHATVNDIHFVAQALNQTCIHYKQDSVPIVNAALLPFVNKCQELVQRTSATDNDNHNDKDLVQSATFEIRSSSSSTGDHDAAAHLQTEQLTIRKLIFAVLQHIVSHGASIVFISTDLEPHLEALLRLVHQGIVLHARKDPVVQKTCLRFFRELLQQWRTAGAIPRLTNGKDEPTPTWPKPTVARQIQAHHVEALVSFYNHVLLPDLMQQILMDPAFQEDRDAHQSRVVTETTGILWQIRLYYQGIASSSSSSPFTASLLPSASWDISATLGLVSVSMPTQATGEPNFGGDNIPAIQEVRMLLSETQTIMQSEKDMDAAFRRLLRLAKHRQTK